MDTTSTPHLQTNFMRGVWKHVIFLVATAVRPRCLLCRRGDRWNNEQTNRWTSPLCKAPFSGGI